MGLGDFLADLGNQTAIGQVAQAFGGRNRGQRAFDIFVDKELPELTEQISKAQTADDVRKGGLALITAGLKRGMRPEQLDKLMGMVVQPALQNLRQGEIDRIRSDYGAQPAQPRPEGMEGPMTPSGNFVDPRAARPLDQEGMLRLGRAVGANPQGYNQLLRTPAQIEATQAQTGVREADRRKTEQAIEKEKATQEEILGLSNKPAAPGQPSMRAVARISPGGITNFLPGREMSESAQEIARQKLENAAELGQGRLDVAAQRNDLARQRLEDERRRQAEGSVTEADQAYSSLDREVDRNAIAREAVRQGRTTAKDIKAIAATRGLIIEGEPTLVDNRTMVGKALGSVGEPTLAGEFEIKRKPRVTTRTKPGASQSAGQGGYSKGVPTGSAPTRTQGGGLPEGVTVRRIK